MQNRPYEIQSLEESIALTLQRILTQSVALEIGQVSIYPRCSWIPTEYRDEIGPNLTSRLSSPLIHSVRVGFLGPNSNGHHHLEVEMILKRALVMVS